MLNTDRDKALETLTQLGDLCGLTAKTWPTFMCDSVASMLNTDRDKALETLTQLGDLCGLTAKTWPTFMCGSVASMLNTDRDKALETLTQLGDLCGLTAKTWPTFMCNSVASMLNTDRDKALETLTQLGDLCGLTAKTWPTFMCGSVASMLKKKEADFVSKLKSLLSKMPSNIVISIVGTNTFASRLFRITNATILLYQILLKHRLQDKFVTTFARHPAMLDALGTIVSLISDMEDSLAVREFVDNIPKSYSGKTLWAKELIK
jgi:hypothetical protein